MKGWLVVQCSVGELLRSEKQCTVIVIYMDARCVPLVPLPQIAMLEDSNLCAIHAKRVTIM